MDSRSRKMKIFFCLSVLTISCFVQAETKAPKSAKFTAQGVGLVQIQHAEVGEPISQPERVEVFVTCPGINTSLRVALFRMCIYGGHTYEAGTKTLTLKMYYGRVEPKTGDVSCDQFDLKQIQLSEICLK